MKNNQQPVLAVDNISKSFPGVIALRNVSLAFFPGEVHALVGENGAGKSTLIKIIGGRFRPDSGKIFYKGIPVIIHHTQDAIRRGISIVYQEYNLVPFMSVWENVVLGNEPANRWGNLARHEARNMCLGLMDQLNIAIDPDRLVCELGATEAKLVEILKAMVSRAQIIIMDEPTAALPDQEVNSLFHLIRELRTAGMTIVYISHRLHEIFQIADQVTVMKDGEVVGCYPVNEIDQDRLVTLMVGRTLSKDVPKSSHSLEKKAVLSLREVGDGSSVHNVSFDLYQGEILGVGGMTGNGQREIIRLLFGAHPMHCGQMLFQGKPISLSSPRQALKLGIGFIPDDRRNEGLAATQSIRKNIALPSLHLRQRLGVIQRDKEKRTVEEMIKLLNIQVAGLSSRVDTLSGGNQQRVVMSKWLPLHPRILLFHEPTLGVDVGAKTEIYRIIRGFADEGVSIVLVTSDMLELLCIPDRILVFHRGTIGGEFTREEATEENIMYAASGKST